MLTRRSFIRRTLSALAAAAVAPLEVFVPGPPTTLFGGEPVPFVGQIRWMMNMYVASPRTSKMLTGITE